MGATFSILLALIYRHPALMCSVCFGSRPSVYSAVYSRDWYRAVDRECKGTFCKPCVCGIPDFPLLSFPVDVLLESGSRRYRQPFARSFQRKLRWRTIAYLTGLLFLDAFSSGALSKGVLLKRLFSSFNSDQYQEILSFGGIVLGYISVVVCRFA
jgi:hypothetical protein